MSPDNCKFEFKVYMYGANISAMTQTYPQYQNQIPPPALPPGNMSCTYIEYVQAVIPFAKKQAVSNTAAAMAW
jgi:hypothetical protein